MELAIRKKSKLIILAFLSFLAACAFSWYWYTICHSKVFAICALIASALIALLVYIKGLGLLEDSSDVRTFSVVLTISSLVFCFAFPPMTVPDESHHYLASYWIANIITGDSDSLSTGNISMRHTDAQLDQDWSTSDINYDSFKQVAEHFEVFNSDTCRDVVVHVDYDLGGENLPTRIGTVAGILFGRALNLGAYPVFYLGRMLNIILFVALATISLKVIPFGKNVIACVCLLPMTLHLAASYSYDAGIIGLALLLTSLLLRSIYNNNKIEKNEVIQIAVVSFLLCPCKVIYSVVLILAAFIPEKRFSTKKAKIAILASLCAVAIISILLFRIPSILGLVSTSNNGFDTRGTEIGTFYTLKDIVSAPIDALLMIIRTLIFYGDFYIRSLIGGNLGWLQANLEAPWFLIMLYIIILIVSAQNDCNDAIVLSTKTRIVFGLVFTASFIGAVMSMYLGWTFNTETIIMGVQGRYALPLLPIGLLALRCKFIRLDKRFFSLGITGISILNVLYLIALISCAIAPMA